MAATDPRRCVIAKVRTEDLAGILAGHVEAVNFPQDGAIQAMIVDIAADAVMLRIQSAQFPIVPQFERFPDFGLLFRTVRMTEPVLSCAESMK
jgi:hypothetical protein